MAAWYERAFNTGLSMGDPLSFAGEWSPSGMVNKGVGNGVSSVTDQLGLTDSQAASRALDAANAGQSLANQQLDADTASAFDMLGTSMVGRDFGSNLDAYDSQMDSATGMNNEAVDVARGSMGAGSADNVRNYLNPMMDEVLAKTNQTMQGNAGATLQSSATNRNIANAIANQTANMWNTAYNQALGDSQNNRAAGQMIGQGAGQQANFAQQQLKNNNQPMEDWINLANDKAMQRYAGNIGLAQASTTAAGQSQAIL